MSATVRRQLQLLLAVPLLLLLLLLVVVSPAVAMVESGANSAAAEGRCLLHGLCADSSAVKRPNCVTDITAPQLTDMTALNTLASLCPDLFNNTDRVEPTALCCDAETVSYLNEQINIVRVMLNSCPVCYQNFVKSACQLSCSPRQSDFVAVTATKPYRNKIAVSSIDFYIRKAYTLGVYESCRHVQFSQGNQPVLALLCGQWGADHCTDERLYQALGSNEMAPFLINYVFSTEQRVTNYTTFNAPLHSCNETYTTFNNTMIRACSCSDCTAACPVAPDFPAPAGPWMIGPVYGLAVVMLTVFLCFAVPFIVANVIWQCCSRSNESSILEDTVSRRQTAESAATASFVDKWGAILEQRMEAVFRRWGVFCASHPVPILIIGLAIATLLSFGIVWLKIVTNPIDLWASPTSRARLEKDYFDAQFGPFYRTEMVIIRAQDSVKPFNHTIDDSVFEFGPAFNLTFLDAVLHLQNNITHNVKGQLNGTSVSLRDICFTPLSPTNTNCSVMSPLEYFQNDARLLHRTSAPSDGNSNNNNNNGEDTINYLNHIKYCVQNPTSFSDSDFFSTQCLASWGGPVFPYTALGGFLTPGQTLGKGVTYLNSTTVLLTFLVNNHNQWNLTQPAMAWEAAFLDFMANYSHPLLDVAYYGERSIEDEIARESESDTSTVLISYLIMFAYISLSLGQHNSAATLMVDSKVTLGMGGVIIVLLSVLASLGVYGAVGVPGTLIVIEVIPFLVLAVGVDNIFILVQTYQRHSKHPHETVAQFIGRVVGETAPSMLLSSFSESACFFLGALIDMPAVRAFALFAGLSLLIDFALQLSCFVSLMALDAGRQAAARWDVLCCVQGTKTGANTSSDGSDAAAGGGAGGVEQESALLRVFRTVYAPLLMHRTVRPAVLVLFVGWLCASLAVVPYIEVGLDQEISMPEDSYMLKVFAFQQHYLSVGPPVYFVVRDGLDFSSEQVQSAVCSAAGCYKDSVGNQIALAALQPQRTFIARPANNWLDDYFQWCRTGQDGAGSSDLDACCFYYHSNHSFCPSLVGNGFSFDCQKCAINFTSTQRPVPDAFLHYLPFFLQDNPSQSCPKAGHAAYGHSIRLLDGAERNPPASSGGGSGGGLGGGLAGARRVGASHLMAYHTILKTSRDYYSALQWARNLSLAMSDALASHATASHRSLTASSSASSSASVGVTNRTDLVFPYSVFYVYYEQYLTMWPDVLRALAISLATVFVVTFLLLGLDWHSALIVLAVIFAILANLGGLMYWWNISLNAVSLVNLVMAVGISVEFCSHITRAFAVSMKPDRVSRAADALTNIGSSVLSGITLTKFGGIIVLGFAHSQIFRIFYFRMYLGVVLFGASHGLILLPVLLSYVGPAVNRYKVWLSRQSGGTRLLAAAESNSESPEPDTVHSHRHTQDHHHHQQQQQEEEAEMMMGQQHEELAVGGTVDPVGGAVFRERHQAGERTENSSITERV